METIRTKKFSCHSECENEVSKICSYHLCGMRFSYDKIYHFVENLTENLIFYTTVSLKRHFVRIFFMENENQ